MTRDTSFADELTQETFFRAYMNYSSLRNKERTSSWLCKIAQNVYYAWYNENKKCDSIDNIEIISDEKNVEEAFIQKELSCKSDDSVFLFECCGRAQIFFKKHFHFASA